MADPIRSSSDAAALRRLGGKLMATLADARGDVDAFARDPTDTTRLGALAGRVEMLRQALETRGAYSLSLLLDEVRLASDWLPGTEAALRGAAVETLSLALDALEQGLEGVADASPRQCAPVAVLDDLRVQRREALVSANLPWRPAWPPRTPAAVPAYPVDALARALRPHLQKGLVAWLRTPARREGIDRVRAVLERLVPAMRGAPGDVLWSAALAFAESVADGTIAAGPSARRLLGRLDGELRRLAADGEGAEPAPGIAAALTWHVLDAGAGGPAAVRLRAELALSPDVRGLDPAGDQAVQPIARDLRAVAIAVGEDDALGEHAAAVLLAAADALAVIGEGAARRALLVEREALERGDDRTQCRARLGSIADDLAPAPASEAPPDEAGGVLPAALLGDLRHVQARIEQMDGPAREVDDDDPWLGAELRATFEALTAPAPDDQPEPEPTLDGIDLAGLASRAQSLLAEELPAEEEADSAGEPEPAPEGTPAPPLAEVLRAEGMALDEAALDNLGEIAAAIGDAHGDVERRVGSLREGLSDMAQTIHDLRGQVVDMAPSAEEVSTHSATGAVLDQGLAESLGERLQELSEGLDQLATLHESVTRLTREAESLLVRQARDHVALQRGLIRTRMLPVSTQLGAWHAAVSGLGQSDGEAPVELTLDGGDVQVDQGVLRGVSPILQSLLVLLARAHRPAGTGGALAVAAAVADGELALAVRAEGVEPAPESTREVEAAMLELGGRMEPAERADGAWQATLRAPIAPPLTRVLMVECAGEVVSLPLASVEGVVRPSSEDLAGDEVGGHAIFHAGRDYPAAWLAELIGLSEPGPGPARAHVVFVRGRGGSAALLVDAVRERAEVVVRALGPQLASNRWLAGACITGAERPVLILDADSVVEEAVR